MRKFDTTESFLLSKSSSPKPDTIVTVEGYSTKGDGGAASWRFTGVTGQTPVQSPSDLGSPFLNDASGNQWELVLGNNNLAELGVNPVLFSVPGTFANLPDAISFFSNFRATKGLTAILNIESGYVISDGFRVQDIDLSFLEITSTDAVVSVSSNMNLVSNTDLDPGVPRTDKICFLAIRSNMPKWSILVDVSADNTIITAYELDHGSQGIITPGNGVINTSNATPNTGTNCRVSSTSRMHAYQANFSGSSGIGLSATVGAIVTIAEGDLSNCDETGLDVSRGSTVYANQVNVSNSKEGIYCRRSTVHVQGANYSNCTSVGLWAAIGSFAQSKSAIFDGASKDVQIDDGSTVTVSESTKAGQPIDPSDSQGFTEFNQPAESGVVYNEDYLQGNTPYLTSRGGALSVTGGDLISVNASTYQTILNLSGQNQVLSGSIYGSDLGIRITIDGVVVLNDSGRFRGADNAGNTICAIDIPSCKCESSLLIEAYNRSGATEEIGYKIYHK